MRQKQVHLLTRKKMLQRTQDVTRTSMYSTKLLFKINLIDQFCDDLIMISSLKTTTGYISKKSEKDLADELFQMQRRQVLTVNPEQATIRRSVPHRFVMSGKRLNKALQRSKIILDLFRLIFRIIVKFIAILSGLSKSKLKSVES